MLKGLLLLLLLSAPSSCMIITENMVKMDNGYHMEKDFSKYVNKFKKMSNGKVKEIKYNIIFKNLSYSTGENKKRTVGLCSWGRDRIDIDPKNWKESSEFEREELIFHELGHCVLDRPHSDLKEIDGKISYYAADKVMFVEKKGYLKDGCPVSYMHHVVISDKCIKKHRKHYNKEIFDLTDKNHFGYGEKIYQIGLVCRVDGEKCAKTEVLNTSGKKWNERDQKNLEHAKGRCQYTTGLPCLKKFTKIKELIYHAICGN